MKHLMRSTLTLLALGLTFLTACGPEVETVVVYTALDRNFSEPIFRDFEKQYRIKVKAKYDTESTKTVGLVNALRSEARRPRCDVFWNNEILNTIALKKEGLLAPYHPEAGKQIPENYRDREGYWTGFAARARVLLVNTTLVEAPLPASIWDLADKQYRGEIAMAKPLFGTTATHVACIWASLGDKAPEYFAAIKGNEIQILGGNKDVAIAVSAGRIAFGLTDTDDANIEVQAGHPVTIVYPDSRPEQIGTLFIPNTVALVKGGPNPEAGKLLIEYLLSEKVESALAKGSSAQIPLNPKADKPTGIKTPDDLNASTVSFEWASENYEAAGDFMEQHFLK